MGSKADHAGGKHSATEAGTSLCPICGKPRVHEYRPFCSKRCADVDLGRWLKGAYVVPGSADADEDGGAVPVKPEE